MHTLRRRQPFVLPLILLLVLSALVGIGSRRQKPDLQSVAARMAAQPHGPVTYHPWHRWGPLWRPVAAKPPAPHRILAHRPRSPRSRPGAPSGSIWDCIAHYESGGNWADTSGGYEGGLQFLHSTWVSAGGRRYAEHAYQATREQQIAIATEWLAQTSWRQWPNTSKMCGLS